MARLGELERKVMDVLWADIETEATVRDVEAQLPQYAYTTLLTILDRLDRKGVVRRRKVGRAFHYSAVSSREEYTAQLLQEVLDAAPDRNAVLARFAETVTVEEAAVLRSALGDAGTARPGHEGRR